MESIRMRCLKKACCFLPLVGVLLVLPSLLPGLGAAAAQPGFRIIVHPSNSIEFISREDASDFFLKKKTQWGSGQKALPIDFGDNDVQEAFSQEVHNRSRSAVKKFWQRQIFTGRGTPPPERSTDEEVIEFVRENPGAIGYVSLNANLRASKVKEIELR
jgi:ABC-type phosphate transport system substrate-binding protein